MNQKTERDIALYYLNNLLKRPMDKLEDKICGWFENNSCQLIGKDIEDSWERPKYKNLCEGKLHRNIKTIKKLLKGKTGRLTHTAEIAAVMKAFHFSPEYYDVIALQIYEAHIPCVDDLAGVGSGLSNRRQIVAGMLDISVRQYEKLLSSTSEILEKGLFRTNDNDNGRLYTPMFNEVLISHCRTPESVRRVALGRPQKATLKPEHFEHLREDYDWIRNLLTNALAKQQRGVNVLIYGKPGTGKTELAKTLCKEIGTSLYAVSDDISEEQIGHGRRGNLAAAFCLLQGNQNSVLLMDEAEDVFDASSDMFLLFGSWMRSHSGSDKKSKLFFHKLLETNPVPVIWACNNINGVDPAHLRREHGSPRRNGAGTHLGLL
jgi:hypothetical protein